MWASLGLGESAVLKVKQPPNMGAVRIAQLIVFLRPTLDE